MSEPKICRECAGRPEPTEGIPDNWCYADPRLCALGKARRARAEKSRARKESEAKE